MGLAFNKKDIYWILSLIAAVSSIILVSLNKVILNGTHSGISVFVLPIGIMILFIFARFIEDKNESHTSDQLTEVALILTCLSFYSSLSALSAETSGYFYNQGSEGSLVCVTLIWVLFSVCTFLFILLIVFFILFSTDKDESKAQSHKSIVNLSSLLLLISTVLMLPLSVLSLIYGQPASSSASVRYFEVAARLTVIIVYSLLVFFLLRNVKRFPKKAPSSAPQNTYDFTKPSEEKKNPSDLSEEEKIKEVEKYADLRDRGIITQEDFEKKRKDILGL
jgi:hypothetical protein